VADESIEFVVVVVHGFIRHASATKSVQSSLLSITLPLDLLAFNILPSSRRLVDEVNEDRCRKMSVAAQSRRRADTHAEMPQPSVPPIANCSQASHGPGITWLA
jgi:hypothetical protein